MRYPKYLKNLYFRWVRRSRLVKSISKAFKDSNIVRPLPQLSDGPSSSSSPRKSSNRLQPIFAIFFKCPQKEIDFTFEPRKTEVEFQYRDSVENFIHESIRKVLEENYLLVPDAMNEKVSIIKSGLFSESFLLWLKSSKKRCQITLF